jgi:spore germination cell wall hydrolase CwlJ-like protein
MVRLSAAAALLALALTPTPASAQNDPVMDEVRVHASRGCLAAAIYHEARSESEAGQRAVAQVIMNRLRHPNYPKTVCDVVLQGAWRTTGCQFTFTCDGSLARRPQPIAWDRAVRIAGDALDGRNPSPVGDATHYHTTAIRPYWAPSLNKVATIGAHVFYTSGRLRGAPAVAATTHGLGNAAPGLEKVSVIYADADSGGTVPVKIHRGGPPPTQ